MSDTMRAEFEAWCEKASPNISLMRHPDEPDRYECLFPDWTWQAWQAAQSQPAPPVQPLNNPDELEPVEFLASRLIDAWCAAHGKQIPWAKAVEITAIVTKMPDAERARLLNMD